ncbi:MAG: ATP-binding cassette domain-containing protein, partial [Actinomycetota bacterium]
MSPVPPIVSASGVVRRFGSTTALDGAELTIRRGEIHAVLGENGAGKTTLMRMLAGLDRPDEGTVEIRGETIQQFDPRLARRAGVALVQQHFTLVPTLTAGENLELARPEGARRLPRKQSRARLESLVARFGLPVRSDVPASRLSVGEQQRLELLRALDADAEILVLDEPTAVLTDVEAAQLFAVCRRLVADGRAVSVITHRLGEVLANCDRVTVLRAGRNVLTDVAIADVDRTSLTDAMVGRSIETPASSSAAASALDGGPIRLRVDGVRLGRLQDATFDVRAREILGVA